MSSMNWPMARSSRASPPLITANRAPDILAAASKSSRPMASPRSAWSLAGPVAARLAPGRLTSTLPASSSPSGTSAAARFFSAASRSRSSAPIFASRSPAAGDDALQGLHLGLQALGLGRVAPCPWPRRWPWTPRCASPAPPAPRSGPRAGRGPARMSFATTPDASSTPRARPARHIGVGVLTDGSNVVHGAQSGREREEAASLAPGAGFLQILPSPLVGEGCAQRDAEQTASSRAG